MLENWGRQKYSEVLSELPKVFSETRESALERRIVKKFQIGLDAIPLLMLDFKREQSHLFIDILVKIFNLESYLSTSDDELLQIYKILKDEKDERDKLKIMSKFLTILEERIVENLKKTLGQEKARDEAKNIISKFAKEMNNCICELILSNECSKMVANKLRALEYVAAREKKIKYFSESEVAEHEVILDGNALLIYAKTGKVVNLPRVSSEEKQHMFLVNEDGRLYIFEVSTLNDEFDIFHSSSCFEKIKAAGEIYVKEGVIRMVSNVSGHYLPHERTLIEFAHTLSKLAHLSNSHDKLYVHQYCELDGFLCNRESFKDSILIQEIKTKFERVLFGKNELSCKSNSHSC